MAEKIIAIPNCQVQLEGRVNHIEGNTDTNGKLTLQRIPEDVYTLMVLKEGYETYIHKEPIIIKEDKINHTNLHISLTKNSRTIEVNVTPKTGNITVTLTPDEENQTQLTAKTDKDGLAVFNHVLYGNYTLTINQSGYNEYTQNIIVNKTNNEPRIIQVTLQETTDDS